MKELKPTYKDMQIINNSRFDRFDFSFIADSPLVNIENDMEDQLNKAILFNYKSFLKKSGLSIVNKELVDIELNKEPSSHDFYTSLILTEMELTDDPEALVHEIISHPSWVQTEEIDFQIPVGAVIKDSPKIWVACAQRINAGLHIAGFNHYPISRSDQRIAVESMLRQEMLSPESVKFLKISKEILLEQKKNLPKDISRSLLENDLGL